ncbi:hypothetical protein BDW71DRAFT_91164 [Aspergillus fruticulosus]
MCKHRIIESWCLENPTEFFRPCICLKGGGPAQRHAFFFDSPFQSYLTIVTIRQQAASRQIDSTSRGHQGWRCTLGSRLWGHRSGLASIAGP